MSSPDFNDLWNASTADAHTHFSRIHQRLDASVKRQSKGVLDRVLRNSLGELVVTVLLCLIMMRMGKEEGIPFEPLLVVTVVATCFAAYLYLKLRKEIQSVQTQSIKENLGTHVSILRRFVNRLNSYLLYLMPVSYLVGIALSGMKGQWPIEDWGAYLKTMGIAALVGIPILVLLIWATRKYYVHALYGRHLEELEQLHADVVGEEAATSEES